MTVNNALTAVSCKRFQDASIAVQPTGSVWTGAALPISSTDSARFSPHRRHGPDVGLSADKAGT